MSDLSLGDLLDLLAQADIVDRIEGAVSSLLRADWRGQLKRHGLAGLVRELGACMTGYNAPTFYFKRNAGWSGADVEEILWKVGVPMFDRALANSEELSFRVPRRQARWAEYVLLRRGVPLTSVFDPKNEKWATQARANIGPKVRPSPRWRKMERA